MSALSLKAYLTVLLIFLVLRSDILLISAMLGPAWTGIYNVAVQGADALILLPSIAAVVLFPRIAARGEAEGAELTAAVCRHTALILGLACLATAAAAWWAVEWLYGAPYQRAVFSLWLLLPGVWCYALQNILHNDLSGRDYPLYVPITWSFTLLLNVALNLLLLRRYGIEAAAFSSTVAYAASFGLIARYWLRRFPEIGLRRLLVLEPHEVRALGGRLRLAVGPGRAERAAS
jgi:O-antigen/teichoic acid export membrane protein